MCLRPGWQSMAFVFFDEQRTAHSSGLSVVVFVSGGSVPFISFHFIARQTGWTSARGRDRYQFEETGTYSDQVDYRPQGGLRRAVRGAADVRSTRRECDDITRKHGRSERFGDDIVMSYYIISMLRVSGGNGVRVDGRRDATAWKQGISGVAKRSRKRRRFFYFVVLSNIQ